MQGQNDLKKEEQNLKAAAQDLHAFNNSASYNQLLYTCLTLACTAPTPAAAAPTVVVIVIRIKAVLKGKIRALK